MAGRSIRIIGLASFGFALSLPMLVTTAHAAACPAPASGVDTATNGVYCVYVNATSNIGRLAIATGPAHPVPGVNLIYGGSSGTPGTSFNSYKSFGSGTVYTQGAGSTNLDSAGSPTTSLVGTTGVQTTYTISTPDSLMITQLVKVNGTMFSDSNVEITTTLTNTSTGTPAMLGLRYLLDWQIGADDGPTMTPKTPNGATRRSETDDKPPTFQYYEITDNDLNTPTPLYTVDASALGPLTVTPMPTTPTELAFVCWAQSVVSVFDYTVDPTLNNTSAGGCHGSGGSGGDDSAQLYWWGRDTTSALVLAPGGSITERALLFATTPGGPPPFQIPEAVWVPGLGLAGGAVAAGGFIFRRREARRQKRLISGS
jgi:hypothetical protein